MNNILRTVIYALLIIFAVIMIFPVIYTFLSSFKSNMEFMANPENFIPETFTFENYVNMMNSMQFNMPKLFWNSAYYTCICVLVTIVNALIGAYVFSRGEFPCKNLLYGL